MHPHHRIVTQTPMEELWTAAGTSDARRLRHLASEWHEPSGTPIVPLDMDH